MGRETELVLVGEFGTLGERERRRMELRPLQPPLLLGERSLLRRRRRDEERGEDQHDDEAQDAHQDTDPDTKCDEKRIA